jgi:YD repeat-containing protein
VDPAGRQEAYDYDTAGHLIRTTDPGGHITSYTYNSSGRQSKISTPCAG